MSTKPKLELIWIGKENPPSLGSYGGQAGLQAVAG
jgi:hypothetical protein